MKLDDNIVNHNEEQYIPIRARGNVIIGYVPLRFFYFSMILMLNLKSFLILCVTI